MFGLPLFILALHLICFYAESHGTNRNMNPVLRTVMLWICPAMSLLGSALTLGTGLGYEMHISTVVPVFVGLLFLILGNYLPKIPAEPHHGHQAAVDTCERGELDPHAPRRGLYLGRRGTADAAVCAAAPARPTVTVVLLALAVGIPVLYSYLYYRRHEKGGAQ